MHVNDKIITSEEEKSFLVVEDSSLTSGLIREHLVEYGAGEIMIAESYQQAIETLSSFAPHVVICDIHLTGEKNGIDIINKLQDINKQIAVVYISADTDDQIIAQAQETKPVSYITKPFTREQLITAVKQALATLKKESPDSYQLSDRELDVLRLIGQGHNNYEIGDQLFISHHAVDSRRRKIVEKLHVTNINQALYLATQKGWI